MSHTSETDLGSLPGAAEDRRPSYLVMLFDKDGKVHSSIPVPINDDESAKALARSMANGLSAELWDGLRYIDRYDDA